MSLSTCALVLVRVTVCEQSLADSVPLALACEEGNSVEEEEEEEEDGRREDDDVTLDEAHESASLRSPFCRRCRCRCRPCCRWGCCSCTIGSTHRTKSLHLPFRLTRVSAVAAAAAESSAVCNSVPCVDFNGVPCWAFLSAFSFPICSSVPCSMTPTSSSASAEAVKTSCTCASQANARATAHAPRGVEFASSLRESAPGIASSCRRKECGRASSSAALPPSLPQ